MSLISEFEELKTVPHVWYGIEWLGCRCYIVPNWAQREDTMVMASLKNTVWYSKAVLQFWHSCSCKTTENEIWIFKKLFHHLSYFLTSCLVSYRKKIPLLSACVENSEPKTYDKQMHVQIDLENISFFIHANIRLVTQSGNDLFSYFPFISPNSMAVCWVLNYKNTLQHMEEQSTLFTDAIRTYLLSFYCVARNTLPVITGNFTKPL